MSLRGDDLTQQFLSGNPEAREAFEDSLRFVPSPFEAPLREARDAVMPSPFALDAMSAKNLSKALNQFRELNLDYQGISSDGTTVTPLHPSNSGKGRGGR